MEITRNEELTNLHCMNKMNLMSKKPNFTNKLLPVNQQNFAANNYAEPQDGEWIKNNYQQLQG